METFAMQSVTLSQLQSIAISVVCSPFLPCIVEAVMVPFSTWFVLEHPKLYQVIAFTQFSLMKFVGMCLPIPVYLPLCMYIMHLYIVMCHRHTPTSMNNLVFAAQTLCLCFLLREEVQDATWLSSPALPTPRSQVSFRTEPVAVSRMTLADPYLLLYQHQKRSCFLLLILSCPLWEGWITYTTADAGRRWRKLVWKAGAV